MTTGLVVLVGAITTLGGWSKTETAASRATARAANPDLMRRVQTGVVRPSPGQRVRLLHFAGIGSLDATCSERPAVTFTAVARTATVGVDGGVRHGRVRRVDPGERLETRLPRSGLQRWHVGSHHGDGYRVLTVSVEVSPVVGSGGACTFTAQSLRTGRIP